MNLNDIAKAIDLIAPQTETRTIVESYRAKVYHHSKEEAHSKEGAHSKEEVYSK